MSEKGLLFQAVSFTYETMASPMLAAVDLQFPAGWTGIVGANGTGKTTLLRLAAGNLAPVSGRVSGPPRAVYCPQRTDDPPERLKNLLAAEDRISRIVRSRLSLEDDWPGRWDTLSHGERKRAQIAAALWMEPDLLAIDEPTNHLDIEGLDLLLRALKTFRGVGLLVSHDRGLLDGLCSRCVFLDPPSAKMRRGNYTQGAAEAAKEDLTRIREYDRAAGELSRLEGESSRRKRAASRSDRRRSKRGLARKDRDSREKIDRARVTGKDGAAGKQLRQIGGRLDQARTRLQGIGFKKTYETGIELVGEVYRGDALVRLPAGTVPLGERRSLAYPDLFVLPKDRVALTGPNGCGKSTLIERIVDSIGLPPDRVVYLPQEIPADGSSKILQDVRRLAKDELGRAMTMISRLGSRPGRLLESDEPSPGETRKLLLALGMARNPWLIVMDEPTNHLDLPSIECLEAALADCVCGLLLVSHDRRFLGALTDKQWKIRGEVGRAGEFKLDAG